MTEIMEPVETSADLRSRLVRDVRQICDQLFKLDSVPGDEWSIETTAWQLAHILAHLLEDGVASEDAQGWHYNAKSLALLAQTVPFLRGQTEAK